MNVSYPPFKIIKFAALVIFSLHISILSFAQPSSTLILYDTKNGLTQNSVLDLTMDAKGFLWIGTYLGLTRFNGTEFDQFYFDSSHRYYNETNHILNLSNYAQSQETFIKTKEDSVYIIKDAKPIPYKRMNGRDILQKDIFKKFSSIALFNRFNLTTAELAKKYNWKENKSILISINATDFIASGKSSTNLLYYSNDIKKGEINLATPVRKFLKSGPYIFLIDSNNNFLLYDSTLHLFKKKICYKNEKAISKLDHFVFLNDTYNNTAYCVFKNTFYLVQYNSRKEKVEFIPQFSTENKSFNWSCILYEKINSVYFVGTLNDGLCVFKKRWIQMYKPPSQKAGADDINLSKLMSVLKLNKDTVIFPSGNMAYFKGDSILQQKTGNVYSYVRSIAKYGNTGILCCDQAGVYYYLQADGYKKRYTYNKEFNRFNTEQIQMIYPEEDSVWVATLYSLYCIKKNKITTVFASKAPLKDAPFYLLSCVYRYSDSILWISSSKGTYKVNTRSPFTVEKIPELDGRMLYGISEFKNYLILSIFKYGLYTYDGRSFKKIPLAINNAELLNCHITYINHETGFLWIETSYGLYKTKIENLFLPTDSLNEPPFFYYYGQSDGIQNTVFEGGGIPAIAVLNGTDFFLPALNGYFVVRSSMLTDSISVSGLYIKSITCNDEKTVSQTTDSVFLKANTVTLSINLNIPYFGESQNLCVDYNYDGQGWKHIIIETKQTLTLTDLKSGSHLLEIRQRTGFKKTDYIYRTLTIIKEKKFYEIFWFLPLMITGLFIISLLFAKLYSSNINNKRKELQKLVDHQTEELSRSIEARELVINIISHDMVTPLRYISLIGGVLEKGLEKDITKSKSALSDIKNTADNLLFSSTSIINWMKYRNGRIEASKSTVNLYTLIEELYAYFEPFANEKGIKLLNEIASPFYVHMDATIFNTIFNNLISNAIKYSGSSEVRITAKVFDTNKRILIEVIDKGIGIKSELLPVINKILKGAIEPLYFQEKNKTGLGFLLIGELAKVHNINIAVNSHLGQGSIIKIEIKN